MLRALVLLLPALIPSWRFFRAVAPSPRVEVLRGGEWVPARPRPGHVSLARMARRMLWNPRWNEALFLVTLAERFLETGSEYARSELFLRVGGGPMRLVLVSREGDEVTGEVLYESEAPP